MKKNKEELIKEALTNNGVTFSRVAYDATFGFRYGGWCAYIITDKELNEGDWYLLGKTFEKAMVNIPLKNFQPYE